MFVASNKLKHVLIFFITELNSIYPETEIKALFETACNYYLNFNKTQVQLKINDNINQSDLIKLYNCCNKLKKLIPIQYILNQAWFYNLKFYVNSSVLIPRPETEELVDLILKENKHLQSILDIGTGSGCVPISIKYNKINAEVFACDISNIALEVAKKNAILNKVNVIFFNSNILNEIEFDLSFNKKVEVIVSNPPYIKSTEKNSLHKNVIDNEPHLALFVKGNDDIIFYKKIINVCKTHLVAGGKLYFELNPLTANDVKNYVIQSNQFNIVNLINDLSGNLRFLKAIKN